MELHFCLKYIFSKTTKSFQNNNYNPVLYCPQHRIVCLSSVISLFCYVDSSKSSVFSNGIWFSFIFTIKSFTKTLLYKFDIIQIQKVNKRLTQWIIDATIKLKTTLKVSIKYTTTAYIPMYLFSFKKIWNPFGWFVKNWLNPTSKVFLLCKLETIYLRNGITIGLEKT